MLRRVCIADVLRTMPSKAIELASFDMYKKTLGKLRPGGSSSHPGGLATGFAGALAGAYLHVLIHALSSQAADLQARTDHPYQEIRSSVASMWHRGCCDSK